MAQLEETLYDKYIRQVQTKEFVTGKFERLAIKRTVSDLKKQNTKKFPYWFDENEAAVVVLFVQTLFIVYAEKTQKEVELQPFQAFILAQLFGWKKKGTNRRRFRKAYIEIARKNGKSFFAGAVGLYMQLMDDEYSPEIYSAALKRDQAKKVYNSALELLKAARKYSKKMKSMTKISVGANTMKIVSTHNSGLFIPLGNDANSEEGSNPHCGIIDEYHLHTSNVMLSMLETGMVQRDNPLLLIITTAGHNTALPCYPYRENLKGILTGESILENTFVIIYSLDKEDDWEDEKNWRKANPSLGSVLEIDALREEYNKTFIEGESKTREFKVKQLNMWVTGADSWITDTQWKKCAKKFDKEKLLGRICYGGLDLAAIRDMTALAFIFPPMEEGEKWRLIVKYFVPNAALVNPKRNHGLIQYRQWAEDGWLTVTDGNVQDYDVIKKEILEANEKYELARIGFDKYKSYKLVTELQEHGIEMNPVPQTFLGLSEPMKHIEGIVYSKESEFEHDDNPITNWMLGNVAVMIDGNENMKIDRKNKKDKIDGIAAMIDAMNVIINHFSDDQDKIARANRDILFA